MPVNFYDDNCQSIIVDDTEFGICDNQNGEKAFTNTTNQDTWIATIENCNTRELLFTAIDNCVEIVRDNRDMENRCDGMLTAEDQIIFIELKDQRSNWIPHAIKQLKVTIGHFQDNHDIAIYRHKRAFTCNRQHPHFQVIDSSQKQKFYHKFKVRLNIQAKIKIV